MIYISRASTSEGIHFNGMHENMYHRFPHTLGANRVQAWHWYATQFGLLSHGTISRPTQLRRQLLLAIFRTGSRGPALVEAVEVSQDGQAPQSSSSTPQRFSSMLSCVSLHASAVLSSTPRTGESTMVESGMDS
ncbi:hypothetical protein PC128_g9118 [Phytophthora cactorum]|nr:hypothetical protein PC128_g9118 [Phytophthora cactorum]